MSFKTKCTNCQASYTLKSRDAAGKKIKCKKCGEAFVVRFAKQAAATDDSEWDTGGDLPPMSGPPPKMGGAKKKKKKDTSQKDEPRKSKKNKGSSKNKNILIVVGLIAAVGVFTGVIFAVGGFSGGGGGGNQPLEQVSYQFQRGSSKQNLFAIDYPGEWKFATGGGSGGQPEWVTLEADDISVSIRENLGGSAMGDIAGAQTQGFGEELPDELDPVARVHEQLKNSMNVSMDSYTEESPEVVQSGLGEGRVSKFTGDRGWLGGGTAYGYRATFPSGPEMLKIVFMFGSEKQFKRHEEVVRKMIASLGR